MSNPSVGFKGLYWDFKGKQAMSSLLNSLAVGTKEGGDAAQLLQALVTTPGFTMAHNVTAEMRPAAPAAAASPSGPGAGPGGAKPRGGSAQVPKEALVPEHEIFKNNKDALAFFFYHQASLDGNPTEGPFWFTIRDEDTIIAGTEEHFAVFDNVTPELIAKAKKRGVIMLVEFENQQPIRCTPCYLSSSFSA